MGQVTPTGRAHPQYAMTHKHSTKNMSLCTCTANMTSTKCPLQQWTIQCCSITNQKQGEHWTTMWSTGIVKTLRGHYQWYKIWVENTSSVQGADTIFFKHQYIIVPTFTKVDAIVVAATQLVKAIQDKVPKNIGETKLMTILNTVAKKNTTTEADKQGITSK